MRFVLREKLGRDPAGREIRNPEFPVCSVRRHAVVNPALSGEGKPQIVTHSRAVELASHPQLQSG